MVNPPHRSYDPRRVCLVQLPKIHLGPRKREAGVYISGALFAIGCPSAPSLMHLFRTEGLTDDESRTGWIFADACMLSARAGTPPDAPFDTNVVHINFSDWHVPSLPDQRRSSPLIKDDGTCRIPGLCSTLGMIIVNLIDKQRLVSDSVSAFSGDGVAWKARLFLFLGFALMAGGLAGSFTVLALKYVIPDYAWPEGVVYWGVANVLQSVLVMLRCAPLPRRAFRATDSSPTVPACCG